MKYYVIHTSNSNLVIKDITEWDNNLDGAKANYHARCQSLWNAQDTHDATVAILDEQLNVVDGYREGIHKA